MLQTRKSVAPPGAFDIRDLPLFVRTLPNTWSAFSSANITALCSSSYTFSSPASLINRVPFSDASILKNLSSGDRRTTTNKMMHLIAVCLLALVPCALCYPSFPAKIPNGHLVRDPWDASPSSSWPGVGHFDRAGGGARNPFGQAVETVYHATGLVSPLDCNFLPAYLSTGGRCKRIVSFFVDFEDAPRNKLIAQAQCTQDYRCL